MYESYYGFKKKPFSINPDPDFLYLNANYQEAIALLQYGIQESKGIVSLIGEVGTGKTMLLNQLLDSLGEGISPVIIPTSKFSYDELVDYLLTKLNVPVSAFESKSRFDVLLDLLNAGAQDNKSIVLLVDEAQNLDNDTLENLRLLSNLETPKKKLVQIILVGQPELRNKLNLPELRQFKQRIAVSFTLKPLALDEIPSYVAHRLKSAGYPHGAGLFSSDAIELITAYSKGIPRLINSLCDNALLIGFAENKHLIDTSIVDEAANDLMMEKSETGFIPKTPGVAAPAFAPAAATIAAQPHRHTWRWVAVVVLLLTIVGGGFAVLRFGGGTWWASVQNTVTNLLKQPIFADESKNSDLENDQAVESAAARVDNPDAAQEIGSNTDPTVGQPAEISAARSDNPSPAQGAEADAIGLADAAIAAPVDSQNSLDTVRPAGPETAVARQPVFRSASSAQVENTPPVAEQANRGESQPTVAMVMDAASNEPGGGTPTEEPAQAATEASSRATGSANTGTTIQTIQNGDTISNIAREKYGDVGLYELTAIKMSNPEIANLDLVGKGREIVLPELFSGMMILNPNDEYSKILLGATQSLTNAKRLQAMLVQKGMSAEIVPERLSKTIVVYRLETRDFIDRASIKKRIGELAPLRLMIAEYEG